VRGFLRAKLAGAPWHAAGQPSAGNGAVMRIAPVVLPDRSVRGLLGRTRETDDGRVFDLVEAARTRWG